jgi:chromosome partitioning protein
VPLQPSAAARPDCPPDWLTPPEGRRACPPTGSYPLAESRRPAASYETAESRPPAGSFRAGDSSRPPVSFLATFRATVRSMPVIAFSSPKGGCGKTTGAVILATVLAERGTSVAVIDADPNRNVVDWAQLPGRPAGLTVTGDVSEETIVDAIEAAAGRAAFVIIDLEGAANLLVSYAIALADFVVIPMQGSQLDAKQAARQMKLIASQARISGRQIPFAVLLTRVSAAIQPKTQRHIEDRFRELAVPVLETRLHDREAFRAIFSFGGSVAGLADKGVSNLTAAIANADAFAGEIVDTLRAGKREAA